MVSLDFDNQQDLHEITEQMEARLKMVIEAAVEHEGLEDFYCEVSLLLVDNEKIRELNRDYRGKDRETDVLSFPQYESIKDAEELDEELYLGDIVISVEKAIEQAGEFNHSVERELCYLTVHSMFHLFGYDHIDEEEKKEMRQEEEEVLSALGITR